jgi:hypothetical protein
MTIIVKDDQGNVNDLVPGESPIPRTFGQGAHEDSPDSSLYDSDRFAEDNSPRP